MDGADSARMGNGGLVRREADPFVGSGRSVGDRHVDLESRSDNGFFPACGATEWAADLPPHSLGHADLAINFRVCLCAHP